MGRFPIYVLLTHKADMPSLTSANVSTVNQETTWESVDSDEPSVAPGKFFSFNGAQ